MAAADLSFDVRCSKGTYIRVLAEDLAAQLGTIAHLVCAARLGVAPFDADRNGPFEALESLSPAQRRDVPAAGGCRADDPGGDWICPRTG